MHVYEVGDLFWDGMRIDVAHTEGRAVSGCRKTLFICDQKLTKQRLLPLVPLGRRLIGSCVRNSA